MNQCRRSGKAGQPEQRLNPLRLAIDASLRRMLAKKRSICFLDSWSIRGLESQGAKEKKQGRRERKRDLKHALIYISSCWSFFLLGRWLLLIIIMN